MLCVRFMTVLESIIPESFLALLDQFSWSQFLQLFQLGTSFLLQFQHDIIRFTGHFPTGFHNDFVDDVQ